MNIEDLIGKTVYVKRRNDAYRCVLSGELEKEDDLYLIINIDKTISTIDFLASDVYFIEEYQFFPCIWLNEKRETK